MIGLISECLVSVGLKWVVFLHVVVCVDDICGFASRLSVLGSRFSVFGFWFLVFGFGCREGSRE